MGALEDFLTRINEVDALLKHVAPEANPEVELTGVSDRPFTDSTLARSCIILTVSYFEGYLKDLTDESFDTLISSRVSCSRVADHLRGYVLADHLEALRRGRGPSQDWEALAGLVSASVLLSSERPVTEQIMPRTQVKRAVTSIDPKKINELMRVLGDPNLNTNPISKHASNLKSLKNIRDNAVHGNESDLTPLALGDIVRYSEFLKACASDIGQHCDWLLTSLGVPVTAV